MMPFHIGLGLIYLGSHLAISVTHCLNGGRPSADIFKLGLSPVVTLRHHLLQVLVLNLHPQMLFV